MFTIRPKTAPPATRSTSLRRRDLRDVVSVNSSLGALVSATQWRRALQLWEEAETAETELKLGDGPSDWLDGLLFTLW